jgi:hypothetical protein
MRIKNFGNKPQKENDLIDVLVDHHVNKREEININK